VVKRLPGSPGAQSTLIDVAATYRLVRLIQVDSITEPARDSVATWLLKHDHHKINELLSCPWCLSPYVALGVTIARALSPRIWSIAARVLAFSATTGVITELLDWIEASEPRE
jgi:hypothetical protein